jgi:sugar lactone lactonase YvrE
MQAMSPFRVIARGPDRVGESPVWDRQLQVLWWVDIESRLLRSWTAATETLGAWTLPERVGCIALASDARLIAALESRIVAVRPMPDGTAEIQTLATLAHSAPGMRFNDGRCDRTGRLWVGTMVMDMSLASSRGGLYCLDERGLTGPYVDQLITPNGSAFSPDGRTFYLSDSHPTVQHVWAFDFDPEAAVLSHRRVFVDMRPMPGRPDGAAVDAQGCYWLCGNDGALVHQFSPQGQLLRSWPVPFPKPAMCCFGGSHLRTLFVTSIVPAQAPTDAADLSGAVVALEPGATGLPEPVFSRYPASCVQA